MNTARSKSQKKRWRRVAAERERVRKSMVEAMREGGQILKKPEPLPAESVPYQFPGERPPLARIIDTLAASHDLADVLVAIRDKVQKIADEAPPFGFLVEESRRNEVVSRLGEAVRSARHMGSWSPEGAVAVTAKERRFSDRMAGHFASGPPEHSRISSCTCGGLFNPFPGNGRPYHQSGEPCIPRKSV